jgi:hypothetical protein
MKFLMGWAVAAAVAITTAGAQAQVRAPYTAVSDVGDPYSAMPREAPPPRYGYGYGPTLLPPTEVYTVVRESGFSPLGIPRLRGFVYTISVVDRGGGDGRLMIDARTGRVLRFVPAYRMGDNFDDGLTMNYGPRGPLPPTHYVGGPPRPPASVPHVASRNVPMPKANRLAPRPEPEQQAAAVPSKPVDAAPPKSMDAQAMAPAATVGQPRSSAPTILPSQDMPKVQGLE